MEDIKRQLDEIMGLERGTLAERLEQAGPPPAQDLQAGREDAPDGEVEAAEEEILDQATAARSIAELKAEIEILKGLELLALGVRRSGAATRGHPWASTRIAFFPASSTWAAAKAASRAWPWTGVPRPPSAWTFLRRC